MVSSSGLSRGSSVPRAAEPADGLMVGPSPTMTTLANISIITLTDPALADDAQPERLQADVARGRRVGEQHHVGDAQVAQDLRADADLHQPALGVGLLGPLLFLALRDPGRDRLGLRI